MKAIKNYFKDYAKLQKACNEFDKKHWKGDIILSSMIGVGTFLVFGGTAIIKDKVDELRNEDR